jgi:hypothetical protein
METNISLLLLAEKQTGQSSSGMRRTGLIFERDQNVKRPTIWPDRGWAPAPSTVLT